MSTTKLTSTGWYRAIGVATEQLHGEQFPSALMDVFHHAFTYDYVLIMVFPADDLPELIYENDLSGLGSMKGGVQNYLDGMYLLDPLFHFINRQPEGGFYPLRELVPDGFFRSEFFRQHFAYTHLKDDVFYLLPVEGIGTVVIMIGSARRFTMKEIIRFRTIEPWILSMMKCHWGMHSKHQQESVEPDNLHQKLTACFQNFGRSKLTDRECDIVNLLLRGHSSKSAAMKLNISSETVKAHRHNIYRKINIKSQSELFSLFINAISLQCKNPDYLDPLQAYFELKANL